MREVWMSGAAYGGFRKRPGDGAAELAGEALRALVQSTGVEPDRIDAAYGATTFGGSLMTQRALQGIGVSGPPIFTVENACAGGGSAVHLAWVAVASGMSECAVAVGAENLSDLGGGTLPLSSRDVEVGVGMVMPAAYAMRAQRYLTDFDVPADVLDLVTVKNRRNGALNPRAHFRQEVDIEDVQASRAVADPLRLLHCCPNTDGAAAALFCSAEVARSLVGPSIRVAGSAVRSGEFHNRHRDMTWPDITARTSAAAYEMAGLTPADIDVVELHDAFSISELLHTEALGLAERGRAHVRLREGEFARDGALPVNPSGGLLSRGHPVAATGIAQINELYWQLTGTAGDLQLPGPSVGLAHVTGGGIYGVDNGACSIHILCA
ncbi:thiolase family protein [Nocardioides sp. LHD-245]|uniref:thiolase family protein n=1 Tax=Nocardioides sp. LHD-245 TaxID=3051387 RepID=UPI0027E0A052|nr:thiolase family protein [Nocardioides sp. LHD-245]